MTDSWKTISHFVSVSKSLLGTFPKVRTKLAIRYLRMKLSEILCEPSRIEREEDGLFVIEGYSKHIVGSHGITPVTPLWFWECGEPLSEFIEVGQFYETREEGWILKCDWIEDL
ncbi:hypothetical protein CDAR_445801 [Caerostris darwini]|uniref:Uncharacterized protein n=1 Tax=Caerostris darwini TaxID=1538125 RepID=A0AAV4WKV6_9ARAC|nr:hypothetical protein CDAR_445801 [Caerostris darwini]